MFHLDMCPGILSEINPKPPFPGKTRGSQLKNSQRDRQKGWVLIQGWEDENSARSLDLVDKEIHDLQERISKTATVVDIKGSLGGEKKAGSADILARVLAVTGRRE